ncbi:putative transcriptional regulator [Candidatus Terasakiella magnetica]|nr:putative transcriptional regulator [Candidatus Terasakiella magnetica]
MDSPEVEAAAPLTAMGSRLRAHRLARGWTLKQVAEASGLAISTVSKVERGQMSPTYDKLLQLSRGLGIDISELFGSVPEGAAARRWAVTRQDEAHRVRTANYDYGYLAATLAGKSMVPATAWVKARSLKEFGPLLRHAGEEFLFVLSGAVEVHLDDRAPVLLRQGESIYFDAAQGHAFLSAGDTDAEILVVLAGDDR